MRIFYSPDIDVMLLDTRAQLLELHDRIQAFLSSTDRELELLAEQDGDPAPYVAFLPGVHMRKGSGAIVVSKAENGWVAVEGSVENLERYASYFHFRPEQESGRRHPGNCGVPGYMSGSSIQLIIEVDSTWGEDRCH